MPTVGMAVNANASPMAATLRDAAACTCLPKSLIAKQLKLLFISSFL
jgi:hypothetical protein